MPANTNPVSPSVPTVIDLTPTAARVIDMDPANTYMVRIETKDRAALADLLGSEVGCTIEAYEFEAPPMTNANDPTPAATKIINIRTSSGSLVRVVTLIKWGGRNSLPTHNGDGKYTRSVGIDADGTTYETVSTGWRLARGERVNQIRARFAAK